MILEFRFGMNNMPTVVSHQSASVVLDCLAIYHFSSLVVQLTLCISY